MKKLLFYILISLIFISCSRSLFEEPDEYYHLSDGLNKLGNFKKGMDLEADHYLSKPCQIEDVLKAIRLMLSLIPQRSL